METLQVLQITWFLLIGILFLGYSLLDGFDLGIGSLLPFLAKNEKDTATLFNAIGPVWDGNEVWLITAGAALFAAFPHVYATVFSGFYIALILVLFALIFRAVSLEFWSLDVSSRKIWKAAFIAGSFLPALLFGVALGNVITGVPLDQNMEYTGSFLTLLRPLPLAIGLLGFIAILMQGATFSALKTDGDLQMRSRKAAVHIWKAYLIMLLISFIVSFIIIPERMVNPVALFCTALSYGALIAARGAIRQESDKRAFLMSSLSFAGLWGIAGSLQFPNLVRSVNNPDLHLTIYNTSSSALTLTVMLVIALIGMPLVIGYTTFVYKIFKGKVQS
jgi:cytochrome bd ubiquinol oxidase subunit II